jgi:hypothetical protein
VIADEAASARVLRLLYIKSEYRCIWMEQHTRSEMLEIWRQVVLRRAYLQRLVVGDARLRHHWMRRVERRAEPRAQAQVVGARHDPL